MNKYWVIEMDNWGSYKSPLMGWTTGTQDPFNGLHMKFAQL
jgi:NADH dehydrogenase (ubiquinone) Fe-S protein 4